MVEASGGADEIEEGLPYALRGRRSAGFDVWENQEASRYAVSVVSSLGAPAIGFEQNPCGFRLTATRRTD